jgi:outer membrane protein, heavy metal efflux system
MSLHRRGRALALCLLISAGCADGADAQVTSLFATAPAWQGPPLALAEALQLALDANPELLSAKANAAPLAERPAQARSLEPPRLEAQIWQWPVTTIDPGRVDMYMFMIEQDLPGRGKRELRAAAAQKELATAVADVDVRRLATLGEVRRAYLTLALARRDLVAAYETGRALEGLADAAQTMYAAGGGSQQGVVKALLEASRVQERMAVLAGEERAGAARLNSLLGRAADTPIGPLDDPAPEQWRAPSGARTTDALARHPEVRAADASVEQAESALAVATRERSPDWMVQGGYMLMPGEAGAWTARVGLTWPSAPWARTRLDASIAEAARRRDAAVAAVTAAHSRVRAMAAEASARADAASARVAVLRGTLVPQARHLVEATRVAFENGQGSLAEALDAQLMLLEAQLDEARAMRELELARVDLETALGS